MHEVFSERDHAQFIELSGDRNPLHVGENVVHGVHILLRALEVWPGEMPRRIRVRLSRPIHVGEAVEMCVDAARHTIHAGVDGVPRVRIHLDDEAAERPAPAALPERIDPLGCRECTLAELADASGEEPLALDAATFAARFPTCAGRLAPQQAAALLAISRVVGMRCPGRHALLAGLDLTLASCGEDALQLAYRVTSVDARFSRLTLAVASFGCVGTVEAFVRSPSTRAGGA